MMSRSSSRTTSRREDELLHKIYDGLNALRLPQLRENLDHLLAKPPQDLSRLEWLWALLEPQVRRRIEARIERRIREARLPARKTFDDFDFNFQKDFNRDAILELATLRFMDEGFNVLLAGMSGTGKSHIAMALGLTACTADRRVRYTTSADMLMTLNASLAADTLQRTLKQYVRPELLILDEVGLEQVEKPTACRAGLMQKFLIPRYTDRRSTIITSNIPWEAWGDYLGDHLGVGALLDRLLHYSRVIVINGPSYRDYVHKRHVAAARDKVSETNHSESNV